MDISARTEYAIRAVLILARAQGDGVDPVPADELATEQGLPRKFLEAILADLRRGGVVSSQRGASGGYRLSRPAEQISIGAIFRAVDGPLAEVRGLRPHETTYQGVAEHLPTLWVAVRASLREVLDTVTVAQLLQGDFPDPVPRLLEAPDAWVNR
ncbi:MAG TPA: Rrf2 family transcriptional regulator [Candidatus Avipropionibacterium avicola]|uniref:Rrf2 family transcriptional regulator n=1 Tax=Candidatus Avipropionibacterium avicola TaxID=2840701 RepID=A0A9D1H0A4_9ACTN|nr:Rrf2 family transcriptional regulator [Candidatus Avipropionibacterium avicola]